RRDNKSVPKSRSPPAPDTIVVGLCHLATDTHRRTIPSRSNPHRLPVPGWPCFPGAAQNNSAASCQPEHRTGVRRYVLWPNGRSDLPSRIEPARCPPTLHTRSPSPVGFAPAHPPHLRPPPPP